MRARALRFFAILLVAGYAIYAKWLSIYLGDVDPRAWAEAQAARSLPPPRAEPGAHDVTVIESRRVVPGDGMPEALNGGIAHNNLDAVRHSDGRVYLAWRSAADHFAHPDAAIHVASSADERSWRHEASFTLGCDLREPRLLSIGGSLMLYVSRLGGTSYGWDPHGVSRAEKKDGRWSALEPVFEAGTIAWRTRVENGRAFMTAYADARGVYSFDRSPMDVMLLASDDGKSWKPVGDQSSVYRGGGSEADFAAAPDGRLYAVIRNEAGDASGWGSEVCRAPASDWSAWQCRADPRKFDSPRMFWHDGEAYLVARRNVTESGAYDVAQAALFARSARNQLAYIREAKRCALWRYVQGEDRIAFVMDLPSRGDTCFAAMVPTDEPDELAIYDYSSDLAGPDWPWAAGQRHPTFIYRHLLRFARR